MQTKKLHNWNLSYSQAAEAQKRLACKVQFTSLRNPPKLIAGLDCALSPDGERIIAAAVVIALRKESRGLPQVKPPDSFDYAQDGERAKRVEPFELIETTNASRKLAFPYIPGLLSFREAPVCINAVEKLKTEPDVFIIDGQGIAHPRRLGLAAHLGLFFDKPTIGCAKSRLFGTFEDPLLEKGSYSLLKDKKNVKRDTQYAIRNTQYETIGAVVRTRTNVKPVFVSVGNKCLLGDAIKIILDCTTKYRLPEPTRLAHQIVTELRVMA